MIRNIWRKISVLIIVLGACICMYPQASLIYGKYERSQSIKNFEQSTESYRSDLMTEQKESAKSTQSHPSDVTTEQERETSASFWEQLLGQQQAYNQQIYLEKQEKLVDAFSYEDSIFDLTEYGFEENIAATLWIPRMEVELPVYLGATKENMKKGAVLLGQTSMPLGGDNTNTVIAAHRGGGATPMFRNIQLLQIGDKIQVTTPFAVLIYRVSEIQIILPTDTNEILIQEGRDLLTLITCHPYTKNTHRYLVRAERSLEETQSRQEDRKEAAESKNSEIQELQPVPDELLDVAGIRYSETQILLEKYGTLVGLGILLYISISGILSLQKSAKARKKRKEKCSEK